MINETIIYLVIAHYHYSMIIEERDLSQRIATFFTDGKINWTHTLFQQVLTVGPLEGVLTVIVYAAQLAIFAFGF